MSSCNSNRIMTGVRFLFRVTMGRLDLAAEIHHLREPEKIALVMSPDKTIAEFICSGRRKQRFSRKSAHRLYAFRFSTGDDLLVSVFFAPRSFFTLLLAATGQGWKGENFALPRTLPQEKGQS